jgi:hypothetical protein
VPGLRLHPDGAAEQPADLPDDGEPQAKAPRLCAWRAYPVVLVEDTLQLGGGNTDAGVGDPVQVCPRGTLAEHSSADRTDAQGHFRLNSIPREATWLALHAPNAQVRHPALILREFPLGQKDFVIRVPRDSAPSAFISGSLVDQQLGAALGAMVVVKVAGWNTGIVADVEPASGRFRIGPLVPARYGLLFRAQDLGERELSVLLAAHQELDLGAIELKPCGTVLVEVDGADFIETPRISFKLRAEDTSQTYLVHCESNSGLSKPLPAGTYRLSCSSNFYCAPRWVRVEAGQQTAVKTSLEPGCSRPFRLEVPPSDETSIQLHYTLRNERNEIVEAGLCRRELEAGPSGWGLPGMQLGRYELEVFSEEGMRGSVSFSNTVLGYDPRPLVVVLH